MKQLSMDIAGFGRVLLEQIPDKRNLPFLNYPFMVEVSGDLWAKESEMLKPVIIIPEMIQEGVTLLFSTANFVF